MRAHKVALMHRFLVGPVIAAIVALLTLAPAPAGADAEEGYEVCQESAPAEALFQSRWDCGGVRTSAKSFDYLVFMLLAGDGRDFYIMRMLVPDPYTPTPNVTMGEQGSRYAWGTFVGHSPDSVYAGRYIKWTLIEDDSVRCWDPWRRVGFQVEVDPSECAVDG
jgi:hypothetical protein